MSLFTSERYSYPLIAAIMTAVIPEMVWEFYNGRAVVENRIEEVKKQNTTGLRYPPRTTCPRPASFRW